MSSLNATTDHELPVDHDMSSMGTACTVTRAVIEAVIGAVLIGAALRLAVIRAS